MSNDLFSTHDLEALSTMAEIVDDYIGTLSLMQILWLSFSIEIHRAYPGFSQHFQNTANSTADLSKTIRNMIEEGSNVS